MEPRARWRSCTCRPGAPCCSPRATSSCRRASSPTGSSRIACRCASRSSSTSTCGATCRGNEVTRRARRAGVRRPGFGHRAGDRARAMALPAMRCRSTTASVTSPNSPRRNAWRPASGAIEQRTMRVDLAGIGGSALTDSRIAVPESPSAGIPVTYVPARNTIMLALALGWAEVLEARDIFLGRERARLQRLSGLPPAIHRRLRGTGRRGDQGRHRGRPARASIPRSSSGPRRRSSPQGLRWELTTRRPSRATRPTRRAGHAGAAIRAGCAVPASRPPGSPIRPATRACSIIPPRAASLCQRGFQQPHPSCGALAQSVEHRTFNPLVAGSIPARPTSTRF